jgi:hypothetical protein
LLRPPSFSLIPLISILSPPLSLLHLPLLAHPFPPSTPPLLSFIPSFSSLPPPQSASLAFSTGQRGGKGRGGGCRNDLPSLSPPLPLTFCSPFSKALLEEGKQREWVRGVERDRW